MVKQDFSLCRNVTVEWNHEAFFSLCCHAIDLKCVITKEVGSFWSKDQNREFSETESTGEIMEMENLRKIAP